MFEPFGPGSAWLSTDRISNRSEAKTNQPTRDREQLSIDSASVSRGYRLNEWTQGRERREDGREPHNIDGTEQFL